MSHCNIYQEKIDKKGRLISQQALNDLHLRQVHTSIFENNGGVISWTEKSGYEFETFTQGVSGQAVSIPMTERRNCLTGVSSRLVIKLP